MALIADIDGLNRRIHLSVDTVDAEFLPIDIYKEMRSLRQADETLRRYDLFLSASGYESKGGGKFTARLVKCLLGTRIVPYDGVVHHSITVTGEIITDEGTSGTACFDRTLLTPGNSVDIIYIPPQVEVIEVEVGSGVTEQDKADIIEGVWIEVIDGSDEAKEVLIDARKKAKLAAFKL